MNKLLVLLVFTLLSGCGGDSLLYRGNVEPNRPNDPYQKCFTGGVRQCDVRGASRIRTGRETYENCQCVRF